ncbi:MAG: hypothetical protein AVDCRST_MAG12-963 [uncultured Rubrobacteraceae bacterium]|uniref:Uncharacterized protein n=1 Tax=uncultured Rubrobacteraceae bacterium TaxID=349277 RepID=A0A6J4RH14_9ACTN|nr:MAG: hypothetical protein AVDCRST_MAG12-963 [uncultured Rubrobacteraceae bacterium]
MQEPNSENANKEWRGSPLDISDAGMDPRGIKEIVVEFDNGDSDVFRPRVREVFGSYELHMISTYMDTVAHDARQTVT